MRDLTNQELLDVTNRVSVEAWQQRKLFLGILRTSTHAMTRRETRKKLDAANRRIRAVRQIERGLLARRDP